MAKIFYGLTLAVLAAILAFSAPAAAMPAYEEERGVGVVAGELSGDF